MLLRRMGPRRPSWTRPPLGYLPLCSHDLIFFFVFFFCVFYLSLNTTRVSKTFPVSLPILPFPPRALCGDLRMTTLRNNPSSSPDGFSILHDACSAFRIYDTAYCQLFLSVRSLELLDFRVVRISSSIHFFLLFLCLRLWMRIPKVPNSCLSLRNVPEFCLAVLWSFLPSLLPYCFADSSANRSLFPPFPNFLPALPSREWFK